MVITCQFYWTMLSAMGMSLRLANADTVLSAIAIVITVKM
jgi:hypothetical protein